MGEFPPKCAAQLGRLVAAFFGCRLRVVLRNRDGPARIVDGDHREIAGIGVPPRARPDVFRLHPYSDLHRGAAGIVDGRAEGDEFADMDRLLEDHLVHGERHRILLGKARRAGEGHPVEQVQKRAAMHLAAEIRHVRRHQNGHHQMPRLLLRHHSSPLPVFATIVNTSYWATVAPVWLVTRQSHRTSP